LSHGFVQYPYAGPVKVREPVARPLDIVALELALSASQAFLVGVLLYLSVGVWDDRSVGLGTADVVLALLGLTVGGAWLYWLLGGVGWPMAVADVPAALFLGFALVLSWFGEDLFHVPGVPLLLGAAAAVYGIACGVFLDSPRRWRWDQREKLRPGTLVPRISPATQSLVAQVPRSLPRRPVPTDPVSDLAARIEQSTPALSAPSGDVGAPHATGSDVDTGTGSSVASSVAPVLGPEDPQLKDAPAVEGTPLEVPAVPEPTLPATRHARAAAGRGGGRSSATDEDEHDGIKLPTMLEPKAQRSPWAWAAPPEWNRDEDDEVAGSRPSGGS
jgi:hypothetical protein